MHEQTIVRVMILCNRILLSKTNLKSEQLIHAMVKMGLRLMMSFNRNKEKNNHNKRGKEKMQRASVSLQLHDLLESVTRCIVTEVESDFHGDWKENDREDCQEVWVCSLLQS